MSFWTRLFGHAKSIAANTATYLAPPRMRSNQAPLKVPPISFTAEDYGERAPETSTPLVARGWTLKGSFTMWEIADFIRREKSNYPDYKLFGILDEPEQAFYTSFHTMGKNELNDIDPETQAGLHPSSFQVFEEGEEAEFVGLSHPSEFPIRHKLFMNYVSVSGQTSWRNVMMWDEGNSGCPTLLGGSVKCPSDKRWGWSRDTVSYVMQVPFENACEAIAVLSNGYFRGDLQPDQNYVLSKELFEHFGLQIFGMGSMYLGFMRDLPLTVVEAVELGEFLAPLYSNEPADVAVRIAKVAEGEHTIFIAYGNR